MSTATQLAEAAPQGLELYELRDDLAQSYNPANPLERMLVGQMAQAWRRLQRALEAEEKYYQTRDLFDAITNDYDRYKKITGAVTEAERFWRHTTLQLEKVQRRRQKTDLRSPNARRRPLTTDYIERQTITTASVPSVPLQQTTDHAVCASVPDRPLTTGSDLTTNNSQLTPSTAPQPEITPEQSAGNSAVPRQPAPFAASLDELQLRHTRIDDFLASPKRSMARIGLENAR